jgi:uncharacterized lipoprotein YmbA
MNKIMHGTSLLKLPVSVILLMLLHGCITTSTTPSSSFYLLTVNTDAYPATPVSTGYNDKYIGVGPVTLPDYLDRPQIVTRSENTELYLAELHRWAEPLQESFRRVLAEYLSGATGSEKIIILPSRDRGGLDIQIMVDVIQFDSSSEGDAVLITYWSVDKPDGSKLVDNKKSTIRMRIDRPGDFSMVVHTLSQLIGQLAKDITAELNN